MKNKKINKIIFSLVSLMLISTSVVYADNGFDYCGMKAVGSNNPDNIKVYFNTVGGSKVNPQTITNNSIPTRPEVSKDGYYYDGWYKGLEIYNYDKELNSDTVLRTAWAKKCYVSLYDDEELIDKVEMPCATSLDKSIVPTKTDYTFDGWLYFDGTEYKYEDIYLDQKLKVKWKANKDIENPDINGEGNIEITSVKRNGGEVWAYEQSMKIAYTDVDNIKNPTYYFKLQNNATSDKNVYKCSDSYKNCTTETTTIEKDVWYQVKDSDVTFNYTESFTTSSITGFIADDSLDKVTQQTRDVRNLDLLSPTISAKTTTNTYAKGTDLASEELFNYEHKGLSIIEGVTCNVNNINELTVGTHDVKCTVRAKNTKEATATVSVVISEGTTPSKDFDYTGDVEEYEIPESGYYKLEVYGGQGGSVSTFMEVDVDSNSVVKEFSDSGKRQAGIGGRGGYSNGTVWLEKGTKIKIYVGGHAGYYMNYTCRNKGLIKPSVFGDSPFMDFYQVNGEPTCTDEDGRPNVTVFGYGISGNGSLGTDNNLETWILMPGGGGSAITLENGDVLIAAGGGSGAALHQYQHTRVPGVLNGASGAGGNEQAEGGDCSGTNCYQNRTYASGAQGTTAGKDDVNSMLPVDDDYIGGFGGGMASGGRGAIVASLEGACDNENIYDCSWTGILYTGGGGSGYLSSNLINTSSQNGVREGAGHISITYLGNEK